MVRMPPAGAALAIEYTSGVHDGFLAYRDAMKAVDPSIKVCAGWGKADFIDQLGARPYDCLGVHSYTTPAADGTPLRYHTLQRGAEVKTAELSDFRRRLGALFPDPANRPELMITEYGTLNVPIRQYGALLAHNLYLAGMITGQLENDVRISINSNLNGLGPADPAQRTYGELFGLSPTFVDTGRARMLSLYARLAGSTVVSTALTDGPVIGPDTGRYQALRVLGTCRGGRSQLVVINRDPEHPITARVALTGATGPQRVAATTLTGPSIESYNTESDDPVRTTTARSTATGPVIDHTFAARSVTLVEITGAGRGDCGRG